MGVMRNWFHAPSKREFKANATRVYECGGRGESGRRELAVVGSMS